MYTSQLLSLAFEAGETGPLANEIRGTGKEKEMRGGAESNLSFKGSEISSEYSY